MAIIIKPSFHITDTVTGVTAGNEPIWSTNYSSNIVIQAKLASPTGMAATYASNDSTISPTSFDDLIQTQELLDITSFQDSSTVAGQSWVGIRVLSGTWDITISEGQ